MTEQQTAAIWLQIFTAALVSPGAPILNSHGDGVESRALARWAAEVADAGAIAFNERVKKDRN